MKQLGSKIIQLDTVDSTNNFAANLLSRGELVHGTVIMADEQTNGRGQRGSDWITQPAMNLTVSFFVIHDNLAVNRQSSINQWVSLAILDLLKKHKISASIKWPNDILVNDKKIGGVLIENQLSQNTIKSSIIGIGLNVNQTDFHVLNATSIQTECKSFLPLNLVLLEFIESMNSCMKLLEQNNFEELKELYHSNLWRLNEPTQVKVKDELKTGIIKGTTDFGLLILELDGAEQHFDLKEVSFVY